MVNCTNETPYTLFKYSAESYISWRIKYITAKKVKLYLKPYPYVTVWARDFRDYKTNQLRLNPFEMS